MESNFIFKHTKPDKSIDEFVEGFWMLRNISGGEKPLVVLPDGRVDLFFSRSDTEPFHITLSGLETCPEEAILASGTVMFAISFKLPAIEYIIGISIANLLDTATYLPPGFWDFHEEDLRDFDLFCSKATEQIQSLLTKESDPRKQKLFELIYSSNGALSVQELSAQSFWSSRQMNRYFNQQFGLSLKAYCNILRFRASFPDIKEGKLFPRESFADQSHFIKEVKRLSGVSPKELNRNQNGRFIQFSSLSSK